MHMSLAFLLFFIIQTTAFAQTGPIPEAQTIRNVTAEGACAIEGMNAEEAKTIALQRARAAAIEQVTGVSVSSSTLVTDYKPVAYFVKAYTKGFIVKEKVEYPPVGQYQKDSSTPPIIEYRVKIVADVRTPMPKIKPLGLIANTYQGKAVYRNGERMQVEIKVGRRARIAIFNIMADDKVAMLFPNEYENHNTCADNSSMTYPNSNSPVELIMQTFPGHQREAEALLVVALDTECGKNFDDLFARDKALPFQDFFRKYAEIADYVEDVILAYEIVKK